MKWLWRDKIKPPSAGEEESLQEGTLYSHLIELRSRLLRSVLAVLIVFLALAPFAPDLYTLIAKPLVVALGADVDNPKVMIAIDPIALFFTPFKLAFMAAVYIAMPVILYQLWAFVAPGLYRRERRFAFPLLASSVVLFYVGMAFAYFVVFPIIFTFLIGRPLENVEAAPDITNYLSLVTKLFFAFGLAFEVPIAVLLLLGTGLVSIDTLKKNRPYVFLGCFVVGMLLTPPDVWSQTLLALPMYALYELGLLFARFMGVGAAKEENDETENEAS